MSNINEEGLVNNEESKVVQLSKVLKIIVGVFAVLFIAALIMSIVLFGKVSSLKNTLEENEAIFKSDINRLEEQIIPLIATETLEVTDFTKFKEKSQSLSSEQKQKFGTIVFTKEITGSDVDLTELGSFPYVRKLEAKKLSDSEFLNFYNTIIKAENLKVSLPNVRIIDLSSNNMTEVKTLSERFSFGHANQINLDNNKIEDISPLQFLTNIQSFRKILLRDNLIKDISVFESIGSFPNLETIDLVENEITDFTPLGNVEDFSSLVSIDLQDNSPADISFLNTIKLNPLKFEELLIDLFEGISDWTPLSSLKKYPNFKLLKITNSSFKSLSSLLSLTQLKKAVLISNFIDNEDLDAFGTAKDMQLTDLDLSANEFTSIGFLNGANLPFLNSLTIDNGKFDLLGLKNDTQANLPSLKTVSFGHNMKISDVKLLAQQNWPVENLFLDRNNITDISAFANSTMTKLSQLDFSTNKVEDFCSLANNSKLNLKVLSLGENMINTITCLKGNTAFKTLEHLELDLNAINDDDVLNNIGKPI